MTENKKNRLNDEQQAVVNYTDGPLQVVAGAGSGKTTVLMDRTQNIIGSRAMPSEILIVTFTKKAANEIKERLEAKIGEKGKEVNAGTFHSVCLQRILKRYADEEFLNSVGLKEKWESIDQKDQSKLIKSSLKDMTDEDKIFMEEENITPRKFESFLSLVRSMGIQRDEYREEKRKIIDSEDIDNPLYSINEYMEGEGIKDFTKFEDAALRFWERYEQICRSKNAIDFDDILLLSCKLLEEKDDISKKLSEEWKYIMLDEYQDTNIVQMRIMDSVAKYHKNICVVGDDQQSIYAFRGSNIGVIRGFKNRYPEAKIMNLSYNYRSTAEILLASNRLAEVMPNRLSDKYLKTPLNKHNDRPEVRGFLTDNDEAEWIARDISTKIRKGTSPSDIAILYRNRGMKQSLERHFLNNDLPYMIYGDTSFFDRKEVQDSVAMIRFIFRPWSALSAVRFLDGANLPVSGELIQRNSEQRGISPHQLLSEYSKGANDILGDITLDTEDDKKRRLYNKAGIVTRNSKSLSSMSNEDKIKIIPKVINQIEKVVDHVSDVISKIDNEYYSKGSIKKTDMQKTGTLFRKALKEIKNGGKELSELMKSGDGDNDKKTKKINDLFNNASENCNEAHFLIKRSVSKSNEIRLFIDTMEAISDAAKVCDIPGIEKELITSLPRVMRNALASVWETYMASSLEKYTKNVTTSDKDSDNVESRVKNVEYILDRFSEKIEDSINLAENKDIEFSEIIDLAIDDLVTLVDQAPDENALDKVQMMTMHASKGLEFKNVYLIGMVSSVMPGLKTEDNPSRKEEELRLFYVGVTRAQDNLCITYPMTRRQFSGETEDCKASPFLGNILDVSNYHPAPKAKKNNYSNNNNTMSM